MRSNVVKITTLFSVVHLLMVSCEAASVLKECFGLGKWDDKTYQLVWMMPPETHHDLGMPQYVDSTFVVESNVNTVLTNIGGYPENASVLVQVAAGDIIDKEMFENVTKAFANSLVTFGVTLPETPITVDVPEDIYLGFVTYDVYFDSSRPDLYGLGQAYYGWVGLHVDGEDVSLLGSYVDLDGNAVITGKYESAIPEPSSALLLIMGVAALALIRRKVL